MNKMENTKLIELVKNAQNGDKIALNSLITEIYNDLYYYILKTVKDENLAADVTQETCLEIITTIDKLQSLGYSTGELLTALSLLEIKGLIQTLPGGLYSRA
jgi:hypothetical protein